MLRYVRKVNQRSKDDDEEEDDGWLPGFEFTLSVIGLLGAAVLSREVSKNNRGCDYRRGASYSCPPALNMTV